MAIELVINATSYEVRVALVENGTTTEFYLQRQREKGMVGNIYKGRVVRVLPGMQAAFVDVGLERTAFLFVDDVFIGPTGLEEQLKKEYGCGESIQYESIQLDAATRRSPGMNIEDLLFEGQEILVQISKEPLGTKGARLTCHISIPSRHLVLMPTTSHIGISKKIESEAARKCLWAEIDALRPPGMGFIVRTVAENATREKLENNMEFLLSLWQDIQERAKRASVPSLVYEDLNISLRAIRDLFSHEVDRLVVDDQATYDEILEFVHVFAPRLKERIYKYDGELPIFDAYGVEVDTNRALGKKIWLRSGGYIVIELTEALTVIDVNTGRYVGKHNLEETILKTNLEAVKEIAYQLRLRNIGGIIIIDFIDMEPEVHRNEVYRALTEEVKKDKSKINILALSEFGLVQMTRMRSRENISRMLQEPCFYCDGEGYLKSRRTTCFEIFRRIGREAGEIKGNKVIIKVHPLVADIMLREEGPSVEELERETKKRLTILPSNGMHIEKYEIIWE